MNYKLICALVLLCCILNVSCVFAQMNDTNVSSTEIGETFSINTTLTPDVPDLAGNDTFYVNSNNVNTYFPGNTLDDKYKNKTLVFSGEFTDIGVLKIKSDFVTIKAPGAHLKNTVFDISGNNVTLMDITMDLDTCYEEVDGAAIYVGADNVNLINLYVNYVVPYNVNAYVVCGEANEWYPLRNLKIINSTFYFEAHNDEVQKYNCAVKLTNFHDSSMENTTIVGSYPLNEVQYGVDGATLDGLFVYSFGIEGCNNFVLKGNQIISDVNKRPAYQYPTLDGVVLSRSDDVLMYNNTIYMTDFVTNPGVENYLYGVNVHSLNNLTMDSNNISIITTGGKLALGTAYPIQLNGPMEDVKVTNNDLYSFSNGPNIGIYSQNFYGDTSILIANNTINVTGLAGTHEWALVTGIESQDSSAEIVNNQIEVHSVGEVNVGDNLYAISYRQFTAGDHTYVIQNNTAFTDGYVGVYLLSSTDSDISGNTLISYNENAQTGSDAYGRGYYSHDNDNANNNVVINIRDYLATLNNVDGGNTDNSRPSGESTSNVDGSSYNSQPTTQYDSNPLIPGYFDTHGITDKSGESDNTGLGDGTSSQNGEFDEVYNINSDEVFDNNQKSNKTTNTEIQKEDSSFMDGANVNSLSNDTDATPDLSGNDGPIGGSQVSQSNQPSVSKKAFEIEEAMKNTQDFIPSVFMVIIALILLIIGYKRRDSNYE